MKLSSVSEFNNYFILIQPNLLKSNQSEPNPNETHLKPNKTQLIKIRMNPTQPNWSKTQPK